MKYSNCRRKFKRLVQQKMRDNFLDDGDTNLITKKFWSFVKSKSNCHHIPELVHHNDVYRSDPGSQAELFNTYFYNQFSEESSYDVEVEYSHDNRFRIDFRQSRISDILRKLNVNKAQGPDGIHGKVLKHCAVSISYPLSMIFKMSYESSIIPQEWKVAYVVQYIKKDPNLM